MTLLNFFLAIKDNKQAFGMSNKVPGQNGTTAS